jgi:hypothetical protein
MPLPRFPDQDGPGVEVLASRRGLLQRLRRIHQRDEAAAFDVEQHVGRDEGLLQGAVAIPPIPGGGVGEAHRQAPQPRLDRSCHDFCRPSQLPPAAHQSPDHLAVGRRQRLLRLPGGDVDGHLLGALQRRQPQARR